MDNPPDASSPEGLFESTPQARLVSIQVLRGLAACVVVVHHFALAAFSYGHQQSWIVKSGLGTLGAAGVDIFFVISGFIMLYTAGHQQGIAAAGRFLLRRGRRIYPLYWVWTTMLLFLWKAHLIFMHSQYRPSYIASSYILWPLANGSTFHPVLDPGWTLTFEVFFYLVFAAAIAWGTRRPRGLLVIGILLLFNLAGHLTTEGSSLRYLLGNDLLAEFCYGILAASLIGSLSSQTMSPLTQRWIARSLAVFGAVALLLTIPMGEPQRWRLLVWGLPAFCIVLATLLSRVSSAHPVLLYIGDASFSIYLGHFLLVALYAAVIKRDLIPSWLPVDLGILIGSTATIALTALSYRYLERPLLAALVNRRLRRGSSSENISLAYR
jgi:exopolysaccharide production protein ExoZ